MVARGGLIELLRPDPNTGKVIPVLAVEVFGVVRHVAPFRLTGGSKGLYDYFWTDKATFLGDWRNFSTIINFVQFTTIPREQVDLRCFETKSVMYLIKNVDTLPKCLY